MATTSETFDGNGSKTDFSFTFPYLKTTDIKVKLANVVQTLTTHYTLHNATTIRFETAPPSGTKNVEIYRDTASAELAATFYPGSAIRSSDLNDNYTQNLYVTQEAENDAATALTNSRVLESGVYVSAVTKAQSSIDTATTASNNATTALNNSRESDGSGGYTTAIAKATTAINTATTANNNVAGKLDKGGGTMTGAITHHASQTFDAAKITSGTLPDARIGSGSLTVAKLHADAVVTESEQSSVSTPTDSQLLTAKAADARYFTASSETLESSDTWVAGNTKIATTQAIDNRVKALVEEIGGFVPIDNETSFPTSNPDINNDAGTLVSIKSLTSTRTSNGSGQVTIANAAGSGQTVTINGLAASTAYAAGFGMLVETTSTSHTYTFHRQLAKPTDVNTVATNINSVNTVATNNANVTSVAGNATNINAAVTNATNINAVAGELLHAKDLGSVADSIESESGNNDINTIATNIGEIQSFADQYKVASSAPGGPSQGDLWYDSSNTLLKYWNGSSWQAISDGGIESLIADTTPELGGHLDCNDKNLTEVATVSGDNLQIDFGALT